MPEIANVIGFCYEIPFGLAKARPNCTSTHHPITFAISGTDLVFSIYMSQIAVLHAPLRVACKTKFATYKPLIYVGKSLKRDGYPLIRIIRVNCFRMYNFLGFLQYILCVLYVFSTGP